MITSWGHKRYVYFFMHWSIANTGVSSHWPGYAYCKIKCHCLCKYPLVCGHWSSEFGFMAVSYYFGNRTDHIWAVLGRTSWLDLIEDPRTCRAGHLSVKRQPCLKSKPVFTLTGTIIHKMNIALCWGRLQTGDWDHKLISTLFTEVVTPVRSRVIFS